MGLTKGNNMANFGTYFLKNFSPNFSNTFNTSYRYGLSKQEEERKKREELKAQQEQQGLLSQLMTGTKPTLNYAGKYAPLLQQDVPLTSQDKYGLVSRASDDTLQRYKFLQPTPQETVKVGSSLYLENPKIKGMPMGDPIFTEKQPTTKEDFVKAEEIKGLEGFKDYLVNRTVTTNPDGTETVKYGQPFTWKKQNININTGDLSTDLSKETTKILNGYKKDQQDLRAKLEAVKNGETVYEMTPWGFKTVVSAEDLRTRLNSTEKQYREFLKNNVSIETQKDWNDLQGTFVQKDPQSQPSIWKTILENYKSGNKDEAWFKEQIHIFTATYGYDPLSRFGSK